MFYLFFATSGMGFIVGGRFVLSLPTFKTTKSDNFSQKLFFLVWLAMGFFIGSLLYYIGLTH
jgi:hypothetical protein